MDRMACVNLPYLPLQLLLHNHPDWTGRPAAVVDHDRPQGVILWVNEQARSLRILPGMRYAAGAAISSELRAGEVSGKEIDEAVAAVGKRLRYFTPDVEPAAEEPGLFWLDASGLDRLHGPLTRWASLVDSDLEEAGYRATVVVGFSRFGTCALAKAKRGVCVLDSPEEEERAARSVPLGLLGLDAGSRDLLQKLGIRTVGDFINLPQDGIARRFGQAIARFHALASGNLRDPFRPEIPAPPAGESLYLDYPETDLERLLKAIEHLMHPLLLRLAQRGQAMSDLTLRLSFDHEKEKRTEHLRPSEPTLDAGQILELIHLRLRSAHGLKAGVSRVELEVAGAAAASEQLKLFEQRSRRDLAAANRALARVRAELGDGAVRRARLWEGHLPEGSFTWEELGTLKAPAAPGKDEGRLVRRIFPQPIPLNSSQHSEPEWTMLRPLGKARAVNSHGPFVISGGWWKKAVHRDYYFIETGSGELLWIFYDRVRRRWFLHGRVE